MVVEKTVGYHITLCKISWPPPRLSQEVTEIKAGYAINKVTRGIYLGGPSGTILLEHVFSMQKANLTLDVFHLLGIKVFLNSLFLRKSAKERASSLLTNKFMYKFSNALHN